MRKRFSIAVLLTLGSALVAQAQSIAPVDSLRAAASAATARLKAYDDSVRAASIRLDSARVGPIRVHAEPQIIALAIAAAKALQDSLAPRMGQSLNRLSRYTYVMRVERDTRWRTQQPESSIVIDTYDRAGPPLMNMRQRFDTALVSTSMRMYAPFLIFRDASPTFTAWIANQVTLDSLTSENWRALRFALISSPAVVARRCHEGDLNACSVALRITAPTDAIREWFDEKDRLRIVKRTNALALRVDAGAAERCLDNEDFSCVALLRRYPPGEVPVPLPDVTRSALTRFALSLGGDGAFDRLLRDGLEPMERLEAAAKLPADSVLRRWQEAVRNQRASSRDLTPEIAIVSMLWSFALGALSLRSSRWR